MGDDGTAWGHGNAVICFHPCLESKRFSSILVNRYGHGNGVPLRKAKAYFTFCIYFVVRITLTSILLAHSTVPLLSLMYSELNLTKDKLGSKEAPDHGVEAVDYESGMYYVPSTAVLGYK